MSFYTYLYLRKDGTPYYVGKGCGPRAFVDHGRIHLPVDESRIVVLQRDSEREAFETEKELIANWGRKDLGTGCLHNLTDGGEGSSGIVHSEEWKRFMSELMAGEGNPFFGKKHGEGFRQKRVGHATSPEAREKMRVARQGNTNALGHRLVGESLKKAQEGGRLASGLGPHLRWHVRRGIVSPTCQLCEQAHA